MNLHKETANKGFRPFTSYVLLFVSITVITVVALFIYFEIRNLFKYSLQAKVQAIASTASLNFNLDDLDQINGKASADTAVYRKIVLKMQEIKMKNPYLKWIDIYRRTDDPNLFEYVADSSSIRPGLPIDDNGDGKIDDLDATIFPGEIYDGSVAPGFVENAFIRNYTADELEQSEWGVTLDASSPIFNPDGTADYVLNVDVDVAEFIRQMDYAFVPFVLYVVIIILVLIILTISLIRIWKSRIEFLAELDRQKDELIGLVAHQLGTPVTAMKFNLELLQDGDFGKLSEEQLEHVRSMYAASNHLSDLVSMILDVSRIQLGRVNIEKQELDLEELFKEIIDVVTPRSVEKGINFEIHLPTKWPKAMLDKRYTRMTIENLLTNAIKYTPKKGKVTLNVDFKEGVLHCAVRDTGVGIPKADQGKIFGKMFRASNVRNSKTDGNGFGLFVAKGAVEAQGGKIWFTSEENEGTTFSMTVPLQDK